MNKFSSLIDPSFYLKFLPEKLAIIFLVFCALIVFVLDLAL